ncbi:MAG: 50S ribosomal protein L29 [Candidatus Saganbacteria bacterium]|nr:50S ribosomal protein L29 [Candidatus Saganbacteria bacterium]
MNAEELRKLNEVDLSKKLADLQKKQRELRFSKARGELKNPLEKRAVKRSIARILTIIRESKV